jgi:hypothetical protein
MKALDVAAMASAVAAVAPPARSDRPLVAVRASLAAVDASPVAAKALIVTADARAVGVRASLATVAPSFVASEALLVARRALLAVDSALTVRSMANDPRADPLIRRGFCRSYGKRMVGGLRTIRFGPSKHTITIRTAVAAFEKVSPSPKGRDAVRRWFRAARAPDAMERRQS